MIYVRADTVKKCEHDFRVCLRNHHISQWSHSKAFPHLRSTASLFIKNVVLLFCHFPHFHIHQLKTPHTIHDEIKTGVALTFFPFTDEKYFSLFCCFNGEKCWRIFLYKITVKHDYSYVEIRCCLMLRWRSSGICGSSQIWQHWKILWGINILVTSFRLEKRKVRGEKLSGVKRGRIERRFFSALCTFWNGTFEGIRVEFFDVFVSDWQFWW